MMRSVLTIRYRLPLLICSLVLVIIVLYGGIAYREARQSALAAASERVIDATTDLGELFDTLIERMLQAVQQQSGSAEVATYLRAPVPANEAAVRAQIPPLPSGPLLHVELWAPDGSVLLSAGNALPDALARSRRELAPRLATEASLTTPLLHVDSSVYFAVAARVLAADTLLGHVVHWRILAPSDPMERDRLQHLMGAGARLYVANSSNDLWTDLTAPITSPPARALSLQTVGRFDTAGDSWLAYSSPIDGAPWLAVVAFPRSPILTRAREVLRNLVISGALLLLVAAVTAWALSRSITQPLGELASAAEGISKGDYERRVADTRADELGTVTRAFNTMVGNITAAQLDLKQKMNALAASESELRDTQQRLEHVLSSGGAVIQMLRVRGGVVKTEWISENITRILGYEPAEAETAGWWHANVHAEDREHAALRPAAGVADATREYRFRHKNGSYRWIREEHRVTDAGASDIEIVAAWIDITDWRHLEEQFRQAQKLEAVGRLAGGVAHDFNNLLTVILGESDLALETSTADNPLRASLVQVRAAAERASLLTRRLLTFSRRQLVEPTVFDVTELVGDLGDILRRLIGEDMELETRLRARSPLVKADKSEVEQIIINLVVNARDAMPDGGTILIETATVQLDENYERTHALTAAGAYVMLAVSDTGTGMSDEVKAHLFEPFFTTKKDGKGTGLGLATCYAIARQFGGHVGVYSELGVGTTVKLYLPVARSDEAALQRSAGAVIRGKETILLVEDEAAVRAVAARILRGSGYKVIVAEHGEEALRLIEQSDLEVDLLFTDVVMPRMGGRVLAERARALRPQLRIVFTSGYTDDVILQHRLIEQGNSLLQKPYTSESLNAKVREALNQPPIPIKGVDAQP